MLTHPILFALVLATPASGPLDGEAPRAREAPPQPDQVRDTAIYVVAGLGTPVGLLGLEAAHRAGKWFELTGGVGMGGAATGSLQWALMPRLRLGDDHSAVTLGAGISGGNYSDLLAVCNETSCPTSYFLWSNFELGTEHWFSAGFAVRLFFGYAHGWCVSSSPCVNAATDFPYAGFGLGYAF